MGAGLAVPARRSSLVRLPPVPGSAAAARAAVDDVLGGEGPPEIRFRVRLLATELVSNSVLHAGLGPEERLSLRLDLHDDRVRVEVTDEGRWRPGQATDDSVNDTPSGRGLLLVGALAELALQQPQRQRVLDQALDRALQRPGAVGRVPTGFRQVLLGGVGQLDRDAALGEAVA